MLIDEKKVTSPKSIDQQNNDRFLSERKGFPHWYNWLISKPFDWISTPFYLGSCFNLSFDHGAIDINNLDNHWQQELIVLVATFILLGTDRYEYWKWGEEVPKPIAFGYFLMRIILILLISLINPNEITLFMYLIIPFSALLYFGSLVGIGVGVLIWLIFVSRVLLFPGFPIAIFRPLPFINMFTICMIFIMTTAYVLIKEKKSRTRAERLLRQLEQSHRQVEELAATRERNRLARDIHDSLGHYLTVISVLLGKAKAFREKNPMESDQALNDARRLANEALQDVRESVKSLRTSQELFSLERNLPQLVASLQTEQMHINLCISGSEEGFSKQNLMVLYRVAQEGLTNVQRHSACDQAKLELNFLAQEVILTLKDNGKGFDPKNIQNKKSGGYGLRGLQERLEMVGGQFWFDSQPGSGTRLIAKVAKNSSTTSSLSETEMNSAYS